MVMSLHKLTAGDGYEYLTRQVAAMDSTERGNSSLADYYSAKGESPGHWTGSGLAALGAGRPAWAGESVLWTVEAGSEVTAEQMLALFGEGLHPNAEAITALAVQRGGQGAALNRVTQLGRRFYVRSGETEFVKALAVAYQEHNLALGRKSAAKIDDETRAEIRTRLGREHFAAQFGREPLDARELSGFIGREIRRPTTAVAGYDLTFSPVKSVSTLWAVAPLGVARTVEACHDAAVADALAWLEQNAAFTRTGVNGVAQVDTTGLIGAAFTHRDSRAGDPDLHTHVAISNKVATVGADGRLRWLALDGNPVHQFAVAASEVYNTRLEVHLTQRLGLAFVEVPGEGGRRPVREVLGVSGQLITAWSSRGTQIRSRTAELAKKFQETHGREPTFVEQVALAQQATLETREAKHEPRSLAEQRQSWRSQAISVLGGAHALTRMLHTVLHAPEQQLAQVDESWVAEYAGHVVATVSASRATWQRHHLLAEAQRVVRSECVGIDGALAERLADAALAEPLSVLHVGAGDREMGEPSPLRRRNGTSVYMRHGATVYTSADLLAAERRIVAAARQFGGHTAGKHDVAMALAWWEAAHRGEKLNAGQVALVREVACRDRRVSLALAPAGTGKTSAMAALSHAYRSSGGRVIGLAPKAAAAIELGGELAAPTDTLAKYAWSIDMERCRFTADEHGMVLIRIPYEHANIRDEARRVGGVWDPDAKRWRVPAREAERILRMVADHQIPDWFRLIDEHTLLIIDEAGNAGTLELDEVIAHAVARGARVCLIGDDCQLASIAAGGVLRDIAAETDALTLYQLVRFASVDEAAATLALRAGDPTGIGFYVDNGRVHVGTDETAAELAYAAWRADTMAGRDSLLLAPTNDIVDRLNADARLDLLVADPARFHGRTVELADHLQACAGDVVRVLENARSLRLGRDGQDFVRNGYRFRILEVCKDGALRVKHLDSSKTVRLPKYYVDQHVKLGYACTIDSSQGLTAKHNCHTVGTEHLSRQLLYVALTRGRVGNHIYLSTAESDPHRVLSPKATHPETAVDVLTRMLARDEAQVSALTAQRVARDPFARLGTAAAMYYDALGQAAESLVAPEVLRAIDGVAAELSATLTSDAAWPVLRRHLAMLALAGDDPVQRLVTAAEESELGSAHNVAAVLDWRLDPTGGHSSRIGPLRWLPAIPQPLATDPTWGAYLADRHNLVAELADDIRTEVAAWTSGSAPVWARHVLPANAKLAAEIAVFRAAHDVPVEDTALLGPPQYAVRARAVQDLLARGARQVLRDHSPYVKRFEALADSIDPRITTDGYWPQLAAHLAEALTGRPDLPAVVREVAAARPLPDEMPAAALWWRLAPQLSSVATLEGSHAALRPDWVREVHAVFGSVAAQAIIADPAWPALVSAVNAADPLRWTPHDLLQVAADHLRDAAPDHVIIPLDEYARAITYSVDMFATHPQAWHSIPEEVPLHPEEEEQLPADPLGDASELYVDDLLSPPDPSIPESVIGHEWAPTPRLGFEDFPSVCPDPRPLPDALADVHALRAAYRQAREDIARLQADITVGAGPAMVAAHDELLELRARADADRPYLLAVEEVVAQWADAEQELTDAEADPLDVLSAEREARATAAVSPAERFYPALCAAQQARLEAAGGEIVSGADVDARIAELMDRDMQALSVSRWAADFLGEQLDRAETAMVRSFVWNEARTAEHVVSQATELGLELRLLAVAGRIQPDRPRRLAADATTGLPESDAARLRAVAELPFTVALLRAVPGREHDKALAALRAAGVPVVDDAASLPPDDLVNTVEQAAADGSGVVLVDTAVVARSWQDRPSHRLLRLLDGLPWSTALGSPIPAVRHPDPPDLDPVLVQARRLDAALLEEGMRAELARADRLRDDIDYAHRRHLSMVSLERGQGPGLGRDEGDGIEV